MIPRLFNHIARPASRIAGRNNPEQSGELSIWSIAKLLTPRGAKDALVATMARFAVRLYDRMTGEAYTADELLDKVAIAQGVEAPLIRTPVGFGDIYALNDENVGNGDFPAFLRYAGNLADVNILAIGPLIFSSESEGKASYASYRGTETGIGVSWNAEDEKWQFMKGASVLAESTDDVASPDLVTTWTRVDATAGTIALIPSGPDIGKPGRILIIGQARVYIATSQNRWGGPFVQLE